MEVCNASHDDFIVWTMKSHIKNRLLRDQNFVAWIRKKLDQFYKAYFSKKIWDENKLSGAELKHVCYSEVKS